MSLVGKLTQQYSGFSPEIIPGLSLWLDGADTNYIVLASGTSNISQWKDKSSNALTLAGSSRPTLSNFQGKQVPYFTTAQSLSSTTALSLGPAQSWIVTFNSPTGGNFFMVEHSSNTNNANGSFLLGINYDLYAMNRTGAPPNYSTWKRYQDSIGQNKSPFAKNQWQIAVFSDSNVSGGAFFRINGVTRTLTRPGGVTSLTGTTTSNVFINHRLSANVYIGEIMIFNRGITTSEANQLEGYLSRKWTSSLPITHPYQKLPPFTRAFQPLDIPNLSMWLDAADTNSVILASGTSNVTQWNDKSGNGYTVNQPNTPLQPTFVNSGIQLSTSSFLFQNGSNISNFSSSAETSVFIVARNASANSGWNMISTVWFSTQRYHFSFNISTTPGLGLYMNGSFVGQLTSTPVQPLTRAIVGFTSSSSSTTLNLNGTKSSYAGRTLSNANNSTLFMIGDNRNNSGLSSDVMIHEFLGFNRQVSSYETQAIESYLSRKWGISIPNPSLQLTPAFVPGALSGLTLWFDAADTSTITGTTNATAWVSKGTPSVIATVFTGTPTTGNLFNGLNYLRFPAGSEMRFSASLSPQPRTWFVLARNITQLTSANPFWGPLNQTAGNGQDSTPIVERNSNGTYDIGNGPSGIANRIIADDIPDPFNQVNIYCLLNSTTVSKNRITINGFEYPLQLSSAASSYNQSTLAYKINTSGYNTGSDIFEILYYNRDLEEYERRLVEGYLAWKWGIQASLPPIPSFLPSSISGLLLWNDASTLTQSNGTALTNWPSSGSITSVPCTGVVFTNQLNGKPVVRFSTTQTWTPTVPTQSSYSLFFVTRQTGGTNKRVLQGTSGNQLYGYWNGYKRALFIDNNPSQLSTAEADTDWDIFSHTRTAGSGFTFNWNGASQFTSSSSSANGLLGLAINTGASPSETSDCEVAEIILYNTQLSGPQVQIVENYLSQKWDIALLVSISSTSETHIYKKFRP